uniref:General transcription factor 3C polypeptide 5-like isoform X1 n=1 Tax=Crassostrea virginica TaxID=6565 RepID=A0A8B8DIQ0_CRAVI|nr:general transcription factor 3C polypeptide 5-like isoform X1 [Crassostrea virginica]XP_022327589.1 general transcription factor 3C polypeptide 5-like isoform X1 [Crassostrea virginica]XP_022327590.1 general transcription factor 3C polypeptide 5-like isoform X1 [Crassostrea virginica]XP_022327591.1 general transcription factor 3C polypeptide 5-like isoform X2 [Crassostrea virginica]
MELEKAHNWTDFDKLTTVPYNKDRQFVGIEYPGIVKNVDKALATLGGIENIEQVYAKANKRVDLHFQPGNLFCKPAFAERTTSTCLLMKVKRRRRKGEKSWENCQFKVEVLGSIETMYTFNSMADFQYLPIVKGNDGNMEQIHDKIVFNTFMDRNEFLDRDVPVFLPPVIFSRFDYPDKAYLYRDGVNHKPGYVNPDKDRPANLIGTVRERRKIFTVFMNFNDKIPQKPQEEVITNLRLKYNEPEREKELAQLFEERPVWSRLALNHNYTGKLDKLKYLLPMFAFYYLNGPWRCMWVKFGYDPRAHPEAKAYQVVDYRARQNSPADIVGVALKRSPNVIAFPAMKRKNASVAKIDLITPRQQTADSPSTSDQHEEPAHVYVPERLPPCRQMFYQMCDIKMNEIQSIVNTRTSTICTEKDGWCPKGTVERVRDIMTQRAMDILNRKGISVSHILRSKAKHKRKLADDNETDDLADEDYDDMDDLNIDAGEYDLADEQQVENDVSEMETEMLDCV